MCIRDSHLNALRAFGAVVDKSYEGIRLTAPNGLKGANIELPYPSVGATEQVLLTAVLAEGVTELKNAAIEPEIMDLIAILQKMGAIINVEPNRVIFIEGVEKLSGYEHRALFDRNEAASWASAALATGGDIFVVGAKQQELMTFLNIFRKVGGAFDTVSYTHLDVYKRQTANRSREAPAGEHASSSPAPTSAPDPAASTPSGLCATTVFRPC